jgi:TRAP-type C4-dicarboxylate transport system permease small subunit
MRLRQHIDKFLEKFLIFLMGVLVIDVLWQVISRYILSSPSSFTDELAGFLLIWVSLFGAAYVTGKKEHLAIDLLLQRSSKVNKVRLEIFIHIMVFLFAFFVLSIGGTWLVYTRFVLSVKSAALQIPLGYVYIVLPVSGCIILFYSIDNSYKLLKPDSGNTDIMLSSGDDNSSKFDESN